MDKLAYKNTNFSIIKRCRLIKPSPINRTRANLPNPRRWIGPLIIDKIKNISSLNEKSTLQREIEVRNERIEVLKITPSK